MTAAVPLVFLMLFFFPWSRLPPRSTPTAAGRGSESDRREYSDRAVPSGAQITP